MKILLAITALAAPPQFHATDDALVPIFIEEAK